MSNTGMGKDGIPSTLRALNLLDTDWLSHYDELCGALENNFKSSPCLDRYHEEQVYLLAFHSSTVVGSVFSYL